MSEVPTVPVLYPGTGYNSAQVTSDVQLFSDVFEGKIEAIQLSREPSACVVHVCNAAISAKMVTTVRDLAAQADDNKTLSGPSIWTASPVSAVKP